MDPLLFTLFWVFGWLILLIVIWYINGLQRQRRLELVHAERMAAMEKGVPLPEMPAYGDVLQRPALTEALLRLSLNPRWPLGAGAVWMAVGTGTCLALRLSGDEYHQEIWPFGLIAVFLGAGLILHYLLTRPGGR